MYSKHNQSASIATAVLVFFSLSSCGAESTEEIRSVGVRPVILVTVTEATSRGARTFPAVIDVIQSSDLAFQVGGFIEQLSVIEAQEVEEGEVIAQLDQRDFVNQVTTARAQFNIARTEYLRAERLAEEDAIATSVLEQRESQFNIAQAALDSAEKALADTVLMAPYAGTVAAIPVSQLENVQAGQVIVSLIGNGAMEAKVNVPASIVATAPRAGDDTGTAFVILDAVPGFRIPAVFREANLVADATSQTFEASFAFMPIENLNILPGMNASVELELPFDATQITDGVISVPLSAILTEGENQYVWMLDSDSMRVSKTIIRVDDGIGEFVTVIGGLEVGDVIVGAGASYLSEGMEVREWSN